MKHFPFENIGSKWFGIPPSLFFLWELLTELISFHVSSASPRTVLSPGLPLPCRVCLALTTALSSSLQTEKTLSDSNPLLYPCRKGCNRNKTLQIFTEVKLATFAIFAVGSFFLLLFSFCFFCIFCSNIKSFKCLLSHHPGLPQYVKQLQWLPGTSLPVFRKDSCSLGPRCAWTQSLSFALILQVILKLIWW